MARRRFRKPAVSQRPLQDIGFCPRREKIAVFCAKLPFTTTDTRVKFFEVPMRLVAGSRFAVVWNRTSRLRPKRLQIGEGHRANHGSTQQTGAGVSFELNLDSETVDQVSTSIPLISAPGFLLRDVLRMMKDQRRGAVLICEKDRLVGIFTERDALKLLAAGANLDLPIEDVMTANPESLSDQDTVATAIQKMARGGYRRMPVVDADGRPKGFVKVATILHYMVEHFPSVVYTLPPQPHYTTETREGA